MGRTEVEDAGVLQEEVALLREVQREPGQVRLQLVDFDLGEVRVPGQVERQRAGDSPLQVESVVAVGGRVEVEARVLADVADGEGLDLKLRRLG